MALSANTNINRYVDQQLRTVQVKGSTNIYRGSLVSLERSSGYARPLNAADMFLGVAYSQCDNSSGSNGDLEVTVFTQGDFEMSLSGAAKTDIGKPVFASDDATLSFTGNGKSYLGYVVDVPASGSIILRIDPCGRGTNQISVPLSSSTSAAASNAVAAFDTAVVILGIRVWFETKPDAGALDVGTDASDPDELVDNFDLTGLSNGVASSLTLAGSSVAAETRIWAKVGQASSTAGVGGGLTIDYVQLP